MSRTADGEHAEASNVIPFPTKAREPEWTHRWPKSLFPPGQHPADAEPWEQYAASKERDANSDAKKARIRALVWEISAMMDDPNCPLRGGRS